MKTYWSHCMAEMVVLLLVIRRMNVNVRFYEICSYPIIFGMYYLALHAPFIMLIFRPMLCDLISNLSISYLFDI